MSTILPEEIFGGSRMDGNSIYGTIKVSLQGFSKKGRVAVQPIHYGLTSLLSWVKSTATPASTLPTVREINMLEKLSDVVGDRRPFLAMTRREA